MKIDQEKISGDILGIVVLENAKLIWRQFLSSLYITLNTALAIDFQVSFSRVHSQKMQRQRSILSFFQKPSQENRSSGGQRASQFPAVDSAQEVRGTDTPPEKVPRQILPASYVANESKSSSSSSSSLFSSIRHKFAKPSERERASER